MFGLIALVFCGLIARTAYIQVISPDELRKQGDLRTHRQLSDDVLRGMITDRNGLELAISVPVNTVWADPAQVIEKNVLSKDREWRALADILDTDVDQLKQRVAANPKSRFVYLARHVSPAMADYIKNLNLYGVYLRPESKRYYPAAEVNAHVVGITNIDDHGIDGIEKLFDDSLTGESGKKNILRDAHGRVIEVLSEQAAKEAKNVTLSIDQRIQTLAYQELKKAVQYYQADSGSLVALDVNTGEILAMVNNPSYNPNNRKGISPSVMRNRAITDTFEPGSTLKPLAVISALEFGSIKANTVINTSPGWIMFGGRRVRDPINRGELSIAEILQKSSNVGTTKLALSLPHEQFLDAFYNVGFGSDTGTGLIGESAGIFYDRRRWSDFELATLSFGYGLSVTSLQLAQMYSVIGNGGVRRPLSILKLDKPHEGERVFSQKASEELLKMLETVVDDGGGKNAAVEGYRVAGKTGTSRKAVAGGYGNDYVGLFAGVAPVSNPRIALAVVINNPKGDVYYGGDVAAPVFSAVMGGALQILNIPNDKNSNDDIQLASVKGDRSSAY
ncbi:penicillin-binding transpeptidase domain-containing protein [Catenovulum sp. 2E275]|uniref:penicillin-binding transpeptidase domain-containing protein n=1 Tax=Catenovulum sp. 2E275 TaxID=2980497 RepID=UPI00292A56DA|nr:penicillin-binding transpeptidase domain-containing protein [Catenovulum sp. 2E275]